MAEDGSVPPLLIDHLSASVLLEMMYLGQHTGPTEEQIEQARGLVESQAINEATLYPVPRETRISVSRLSGVLAILAYQPGGVQFGPLHFEARPKAQRLADMPVAVPQISEEE